MSDPIDTNAELAWILDLEEQQEIQPDIADRCHGWLDEVDRLRAELAKYAAPPADRYDEGGDTDE